MCRKAGIQKVYLTGQNTDPLLYRHLQELIDFLKEQNFLVGIRTNGLLAEEKMSEINSLNDELGFSIQSLNPDMNQKITGFRKIPDWKKIIPLIQSPLRLSIVVNQYNYAEILSLIQIFSSYDHVRYIQLRCIATDERYEELEEDMRCYKKLATQIEENFPYVKDFYTASIYQIYGKEVSLWKTVQTTINSYNYFTDGIISDDYFVVEGYKKTKNQDQK